MKDRLARWFRRGGTPDASASRWAGSSMLPSQYASTGFAADSRWGPPGLGDEQRWLRQFHASRRWAIWGVLLGALVGALLFAPAQWLAAAVRSTSRWANW